MAEQPLEAATSSGTSNETQSQSAPLCKLFEPLQPPDTRRVSSRTTKGQRPFRYSPTNYCLYILLILCCFDTVVDAASLPLWNKEITKEQPIINKSILWHSWEAAIFLKEYQFLTVVYKVLSPRTSDKDFLFGGSFNKTEINAPSWYTEWEKEIELWTQRSLSFTLVDVPQEADHRRRKRSTKTLPPTKRVVRPTSYIFNENTFRQTSSILIVSDAVISTNCPNRIVVRQVGAHGQSLISHDQELVRSNRRISLRNLIKHRLSQWAAADNEIFKSELGIDVERGAHITSNIGRLQTIYQQAFEDPCQWFHSRFEELNLLFTEKSR